jgi:hypothetical protein
MAGLFSIPIGLPAPSRWGYSFFGGWNEDGTRNQIFKSGFPTKDAASKAQRAAIAEHEATNGKVGRESAGGRRVWAFTLGSIHQSGFTDKVLAEQALRKAAVRAAAAASVDPEKEAEAKAGPKLETFIGEWLDAHAARRCAPKTIERYRELSQYIVRELGSIRVNELTTARVQEAIHHFEDHGGQVSSQHPKGRPLAPKTVRHIDTLLFTCLAEADRLGVLKIPHPMANKRVLLPKLVKKRATVLDKDKLASLFEQTRGTRLFPLVGVGYGMPPWRAARAPVAGHQPCR